jgi:cysteine desulfurase/selenocysteine lyase
MVYLDNAATTWPKPEMVYSTLYSFMKNSCANPGRSAHKMARISSSLVLKTREALSELFYIQNPLDIAFTANATQALNLAIQGVLRQGDHVVTTAMEHNSVLRPLYHLKQKGIIDYSVVMPYDSYGNVSPSSIAEAIRPNTRLIALSSASNVTGTILPYEEVGEIARIKEILFLVDAAQGAGVLDLDVKAMNISLLAFPGHKGLMGPQGTGGLYVAPGVEMRPVLYGGTGSRSFVTIHPDFMPDMLEAGTVNSPGIAGLGAGLRWLMGVGLDRIRKKKKILMESFFKEIGRVSSIRFYSERDASKNAGIISLIIPGMDSSEIGNILDQKYGIAVRSGFHCAPLAHETLGTMKTGLVRISPGYFNTAQEMEYAARAIREIAGG